ncbi:hypothetical protein D3C87_1998870 [compost metagenome]
MLEACRLHQPLMFETHGAVDRDRCGMRAADDRDHLAKSKHRAAADELDEQHLARALPPR